MSPNPVVETPVAQAPVTFESRIAATLSKAMETPPVLQQAEPVAPQTPQAPAGEPVQAEPTEVVDDYVFDPEVVPAATEPVTADQTTPQQTVQEAEIAEIKQAFAERGGISDTKAQKVYASFVEMREVEKGLGYKPNAEQILNATKTAQDLELMRTDFETVAPTAPQDFTAYWFTKPGAVEMAANLPLALSDVNPQAFEALASPIMTYTASQIEAFAQDERRSPEERENLKYAADLIRHVTKTGTSGVSRTPQAAPTDEVTQLRNELARLKGAQQNQVVTGIKQQIEQHEAKTLSLDVARALEILDKNFPNSPTLKAMARERLMNVAKNAVLTNPNVANVVNAQKQRMIARGNIGELDQMTRMIRQAYGNALTNERTAFLKEIGPQLQAKSQQAAATLQQGSQKTTLPNNGTTPDRTGVPLAQQPGESPMDYKERVLRTRMQQGRPS